MQRVATEDALDAEPTSLQRAVALDRLKGVVRARRREATLRDHQMRDAHLVSTDHRHHREPRPATDAHVIRLTTSVNSARRTANGTVYAAGLARTTISTGDSTGRPWRL